MGERIPFEHIEGQARRLGRVGCWAPGDYMSKCVACEALFEGDKRAVHCLPCAVGRLTALAERSLDVDGMARLIAMLPAHRIDDSKKIGNFISPREATSIAVALSSFLLDGQQ